MTHAGLPLSSSACDDSSLSVGRLGWVIGPDSSSRRLGVRSAGKGLDTIVAFYSKAL
jgi:hypothetical protein